MKHLIDQIKFIDTILLPIFGIENIYDYKTIICLQTLDVKIVVKLNKTLDKFKTVFPIKNFNLYKTDNKIVSLKHAFNFLKQCLEIALVPFFCNLSKGKKYLRLISMNKILYKYITKKAEKRTFENKEINPLMLCTEPNNIISEESYEKIQNLIKLKTETFEKAIKKTNDHKFSISMKNILKCDKKNEFKFDMGYIYGLGSEINKRRRNI